MGNTKKRIKRSKRVKMRKAKHTRKTKHTRKAKKKKTKQRGRGSPPDFPLLPEGNHCRYKRSDIPGPRKYRERGDCETIYGCEWGTKLSALHPMRDRKPRCHKARLCDYRGYTVPCYLFNDHNERNKDLIYKIDQQNLKQVV